ncbi:hypothetical protein SAMN05216327_11234 [Dyadobacter sp. SG02]|uniref:hypothetical protein n=1 Tax=Dyadobacter sp. SG02 TaxID=1855291 RepID=UPI0008C961F1|nr:hypothetical protein [Dyadobacter sp. SG02]SEJ52841.1 hypothetical protein SAMN05216327_11234 [Dyadobacter sp. SG02]
MDESKNLCAYIDLLGFANHVQNDREAALRLLADYQNILHVSHFETNLGGNGISSFNYFIPFSDSIFFYSSSPSLFIQQLANFVYSSFGLSSDEYANPLDSTKPEQVTMIDFSVREGKVITTTHLENWQPLLLGGGIGYVTLNNVASIYEGRLTTTPILVGRAVVDAVRLEGSGLKGPRILLNDELFRDLDDNTKLIVNKVPEKAGYFEVNWTAVRYLDYLVDRSFQDLDERLIGIMLLNDFNMNMLVRAANLWRAYKNKEISTHYFSFVKLIVRGALHFFRESPHQKYVRAEIKCYVDQLKLEYTFEDIEL